MLKIGALELKNNRIAAPLAGISNRAYRRIMNEFQIGLTVTEMTSSKAINYRNVKTLEMVDIHPDEGMVSLQLFGDEIDAIHAAVKFINTHSNAALIDLNAGCPVPKVVHTNARAALMKNPSHAYALLKAMVDVARTPVTVKIRTGWDTDRMTGVDLAQLAEKAGVAMIAIHGRTRAQKYNGHASLEAIKKIKESVTIPVIGNGDITTPEAAKRMLDETGVDGVMMGRGLMGNPWLIKHTLEYLETGSYDPYISVAERFAVLKRHANYLLELKGETIAVLELRAQASQYVRQLKYSSAFRKGLMPLKTMPEVLNHIALYEADLQASL